MTAPPPPHSDWAQLAAEWQSAPVELPPLGDLAARDRAHRRRLALVFASEAVLTAAALGFSAALVGRLDDVIAWTAAITIWVTLAVVWTFTLWNRSGTWRPLVKTVEGYLAVSELRCRRKIRTARFVAGFVLVETAALTVWRHVWFGGFVPAGHAAAWRLALVALIVLGYLAWATWFERRARRDLAWLEGLRASLSLPEL